MLEEKQNIEQKNKQEKNISEEEKKKAMLSYFWILCLIPFLDSNKSKFVQFHAKQGLVLFGLSMFTIVPVFGWFLCIVLMIVSVYGILQTLNGKWWKIPYVYDWSKKINLNNK